MEIVSNNRNTIIEFSEDNDVYFEDRLDGKGAFLKWEDRPQGVEELVEEIRKGVEKIERKFHKLLPNPGQQYVTIE